MPLESDSYSDQSNCHKTPAGSSGRLAGPSISSSARSMENRNRQFVAASFRFVERDFSTDSAPGIGLLQKKENHSPEPFYFPNVLLRLFAS